MNRGIKMGKNLRLTIGSDKEGLEAIFRPYQALLLAHLWKINQEGRVGLKSGQAWEYLLNKPEKKSRASVIFFLNDLVDAGILEYEEKTGKGGYHRIYYPTMTAEEFWIWLVGQVKETLINASGMQDLFD